MKKNKKKPGIVKIGFCACPNEKRREEKRD